MLNQAKLHESQRYYEVTIQGKTYRCSRVSDIIENTSPTNKYLKQWMVNCGVEALFGQDLSDYRIIPDLKKLAWQAHQIKSQQALDIGTNVHRMIKQNAFEDTQCEESRACWESFSAFYRKYLPIPIGQEIALYDIKNLYAGTMDWIGILGAKKAIRTQKKAIYILDWKTSKAINHNYKIQVAVYKRMVMCLLKEFIKYPSRFDQSSTRILNDIILAAGKKPKIVCGIVRLPKKPSARKPFEFVELTAKEEKACLREFALMAKLYNHREKEKNVCQK